MVEQHRATVHSKSGSIFQRGMGKMAFWLAARKIGKEDFLMQLKEAWGPLFKKNTDIEDDVRQAMSRVRKSGYEWSFQKIGITEEDIRQVLLQIKSEKTTPVRVERTPGRNDLCPCGSGKKYKVCCGR